MALPLFRINELKIPNLNETYEISEKSFWQHLILAQRHKKGDKIKLTDGINAAGIFEIHQINSKNKTVFVKIIKILKVIKSKPEKIVVQAIIKSPADALAIDLLTQSGVDKIIPWKAEKSIAKWKDSHNKKFLNQIISSSEQSRRLLLPQLEKPLKTAELLSFLKHNTNSIKVFILDNSDYSEKIRNNITQYEEPEFQNSKFRKLDAVVFIVGPEGGLSAKELSLFRNSLDKQNCEIISLGENIFKSSFAGAAALLKFF
ncbi:MAG: RsmE family RNA methyltransferase [Bifidobacteriaceae bacterium]|jgi:16S rRNA (uracil1498-N3)-methyltransferase|nr:RsmE family RNA methyltransferase [Bifidobacteriaceae bacterium]